MELVPSSIVAHMGTLRVLPVSPPAAVALLILVSAAADHRVIKLIRQEAAEKAARKALDAAEQAADRAAREADEFFVAAESAAMAAGSAAVEKLNAGMKKFAGKAEETLAKALLSAQDELKEQQMKWRLKNPQVGGGCCRPRTN